MAKNDLILLDGIIEEILQGKVINDRECGEVFERLVMEQLLKDYDLSIEEIEYGIVDGRNDGGIDGFYIFVNGHLLIDIDTFQWPKANSELELYIITCKHNDTFKMQVLDSLIASLSELLDFSIETNELKGEYNEEIIEKREQFLKAYKKIASRLTSFKIKTYYASRGSVELISNNIKARNEQLKEILEKCFSNCKITNEFVGSAEILQLYRKKPKLFGDLKFTDLISQECNYIILTKLKDLFNFIVDDEGKLKRYYLDSNIRDYIGLTGVNEDIMNTLKNKKSPEFWLLNNRYYNSSNFSKCCGENNKY